MGPSDSRHRQSEDAGKTSLEDGFHEDPLEVWEAHDINPSGFSLPNLSRLMAGNHVQVTSQALRIRTISAFPLGNPEFSKRKTKLVYEGLHSHDKQNHAVTPSPCSGWSDGCRIVRCASSKHLRRRRGPGRSRPSARESNQRA